MHASSAVTAPAFENALFANLTEQPRQHCAQSGAERGQKPFSPPLVRSVAERAGLGRFVYLQGASGRRYIFSAISQQQATLYGRAVFACVLNDRVCVVSGAGEAGGSSGELYVHLPQCNDADRLDTIIADLSAPSCL